MSDDFKPEVFQAPEKWNGKCVFCGEPALLGGWRGGKCISCGHITIPPYDDHADEDHMGQGG